MKSIITLVFAAFITLWPSYSQSFGSYSIATTLSKEDCMDRIDEWVALNLDSYQFNVDYKNPKTGKTIIKGILEDKNNEMYSVSKGAVKASIQYLIVTEASDSCCVITFKELNYCFESGGYVNYDYIATQNLELMIDEMDYVELLGEKIAVNQDILDKTQDIIKEYDSLIEQIQDPTLKKSERKKLIKKEKELSGQRNVLLSVGGSSSAFVAAVLQSLEETLK